MKNGTVVSTGDNTYEQCGTRNFSDIKTTK
jgi:hypothetical protein